MEGSIEYESELIVMRFSTMNLTVSLPGLTVMMLIPRLVIPVLVKAILLLILNSSYILKKRNVLILTRRLSGS